MKAGIVRITVVVAVIIFAVEYVLNSFAYQGLYATNHNAGIPWHQPTAHGFAVVAVTTIIGAIAYAHIFLHGYEGHGVIEGARFGVWAWLLVSVPEVFGYAASLDMGRRLALAQTGADLVALVIAGLAAGAIAGSVPANKTAAAS